MTTEKIEQAKALLAQLEALGEEEVKEDIAALKAKIADMEAKALAEAKEIVNEAKEIEEGLIAKYGASVVKTVEIALVLAIFFRVFGVI
ncbi:MAG: hypothetical protein P4N41_18205 [Negativicutes bacterium]|nr:hypothetical protein [Negativicutes bacterium]